jgi:acetylglutamate synthase
MTTTQINNQNQIVATGDLGAVLADLAAVVSEAFGKSLPPDYGQRPIERVYATPDHLAFGVVARLSDGTPYLDKLAVSPQLQGSGIGESLWHRVTADYPAILWRSHAANPFATWYHRHADVMKRDGEWLLFGYGVGFERLEAMASELVAIPAMR